MILIFFLIYSVQSIQKLKLLSVPTSNYYNVQYYTTFSVGTPGQVFTAIIDSGSYLLWIPSISINCESCNKFNDSLSSTYTPLDKHHSINYIGGYVEGKFSLDSIKISGLTSKTTQFLLVDYEKNLKQLASDGILGLGYNGKENLKYSLVYNLYLEGQIGQPVFAIDFNSQNEDSYIYIGGYESEKIREKVAFELKVFEDFYSWSGVFNGVKFGSVEINDYNVLFFDTGLTFFSGPEKLVKMIFEEIGGILECTESSYLKCKCSKGSILQLPQLFFKFDSGELRIGPENYIGYSQGTCTVMILKTEYMHWGAGMGFFREYFTVFNYSDARITFYQKSEVVEASFFSAYLCVGIIAVALLKVYNKETKPNYYARINDIQ